MGNSREKERHDPDSPKDPSRRRFLVKSARSVLMGIGALVMTGSVVDIGFGVQQTNDANNEAAREYPRPTKEELEKASEQIIVFEEKQRQLAKEGQFGEELKEAFRVSDQEISYFNGRRRLMDEKVGVDRTGQDLLFLLGGGAIASVGAFMREPINEPSSNRPQNNTPVKGNANL